MRSVWVGFFVIISLFGCSLSSAISDEEGGINSISLAFIGSPSDNFFNEVMDSGSFYAKNGLAVHAIFFNSGTEAIDSVLNGSTDFAVTNSYSVAQVLKKNKKPVILSSVVRIDGIYYMVIDRRSGIEVPSHLNGKQIGLEPVDDWKFYLEKFLTINDVDNSSITYHYLQPEEILQGLNNGEIDAGLLSYSDASAFCSKNPDRYKLWSINDQDNFYQVLIGNTDLINDHPQVVTKILNSFVDLGKWYNGNIESVEYMITTKMNLPREKVHELMSGISPEVSLTQGLLSTLEEQSRYLNGNEGKTPDYIHLINFSFLDSVYPEGDTIIHE